ncbi:MAG: rRNA maturation RNase YbeY [Candidatus Omnitrophota bacterium]
MVQVYFANHQTKIRLNPNRIQRTLRKILKKERVTHAHLSVVFVTDQKIKSLNKKFLKKNRPTDVLAFDLREPSQKSRKVMNGEIIISTDTAKRNASIFKTTIENELTLYVIHGILHLLGFDDHAPRAMNQMRAKEQEMLRQLTK